MEDPIKIIFKYKNNNRRVQYHTYIFVGSLVPKNIMKILNRIKNLSLYETFMEISVKENNKLKKHYGLKWYTLFFNTYHILYTMEQIRQDRNMEINLRDKYGDDWYDEHITEFKLVEKPIYYNYNVVIKDEIIKREKKRTLETDIDEDVNEYTTTKVPTLETLTQQYRQKPLRINNSGSDYKNNLELYDKMAKYNYRLNRLRGGEYPDYPEEYYINNDVVTNVDDIDMQKIRRSLGEEADIDNDGVIEFDEGLSIETTLPDEELDIQELDLEDIEKLYEEVDMESEKEVSKTSSLIEQALKDDKIFEKMENQAIEFDTSKDNLMYDEQLRNVYDKFYVVNQYIYKDDTIKTIKYKICSSIKNNPKFEQEAYITPTRQYLWSEYFYEDKIEKVMIGQKWIRRSDILNIDIEPNNNLRYYEELVGNLKSLRDNLRRYGSRIKYDDDDNNILYDYEDYFSNNEIYLIDIYNELGKNYSPDPETLRNLTDVYIKIYFKKMKTDDIKYIIEYLNGNTTVESNKNKTIYETINNDLVIENEIMTQVEKTKKNDDFKQLFKPIYIIQSFVRTNLRIINNENINLYRIFDEFVVDNNYPFVQYHTLEGQIIFKYSEKDILEFSSNKDNLNILTKWFENSPHGLSFKVKIQDTGTEEDRFMAINLGDTGLVNYKIQWKEEARATIDDTKRTYIYVKELVNKINMENNKIKFAIPEDYEFKYAFMNTMQQFGLPGKFLINHNDLSEFARYFYPYVALVIEPRKRVGKMQVSEERSKYGTYVRYKRVSKYENQIKIEQRILYFMRNYEYTNETLANEISKHFNITPEYALESIIRTQAKHPNLKKSRKVLKKLENLPKYKAPGIGIDIQGKERDNYKIRISGARDRNQLHRITDFINVLIYLYVETYLYKKQDRLIFKEKLRKLIRIAHRRHKVYELVDYDKEKKTVKQMAQMDKKRIGFKPEKGQSGWTRLCQNSGRDKRRRPEQVNSADDLLAIGFNFNKKSGTYEKKVKLKNKNEETIRAIELPNYDESGTPSSSIYYFCDPEKNGEQMHIGFLYRSSNPYGQCMPCCFKRDALLGDNQDKKDFFLKCLGKPSTSQIQTKQEQMKPEVIEKLYILQDTNKIPEGRFGFLPKFLDYYLNELLGKTIKIKQHYLTNSPKGFFLKYGSKQNEYSFLNAIGSCMDLTVREIKQKIIDSLEKDVNDKIFTALNNGDIRTGFESKENYIEFIKLNPNLDYESTNHILSIPNIIHKKGLNIIVFRKEITVIKKELEKDKINEDFIILCQNPEEVDNLKNSNRETILLVKENKNYYPIMMVIKNNNISKDFVIIKSFQYSSYPDNVINHIFDFYKKNCVTDVEGLEMGNLLAKDVYQLLIDLNVKDYLPQYQIIDSRNKCKYIITNNSTIIPTRPSGSIYNLQILKSKKSIQSKLHDTSTTISKLTELDNEIRNSEEYDNNVLNVKPIGVYYDNKYNNTVSIVGVMTELYDIVPTIQEEVSLDYINQQGLVMEYRELTDRIDDSILRDIFTVDDRIKEINYNNYYNESYELFRFHLSNYLENNDNVKKKIERILNSKIPRREKKNNISSLLFKIIDKKLYDLFKSQEPSNNNSKNNQQGGKSDKFIQVLNNIPDLTNYRIRNIREDCTNNIDKDDCTSNIHCQWSYDSCSLGLTREMIVTFVNKVSEELVSDSYKTFEILKIDGYYVSEIVDYSIFTQRPGQKIVKSTSTGINKILEDLFGKENVPNIGRRKVIKTTSTDLIEMNEKHPLINMGEYFSQTIINDNIVIFRSFANSYAWIRNSFYDIESRNLGYYSNLQTNIANYLRSNVIDWLIDPGNYNDIINNLSDYMETDSKNFIKEFIGKITKSTIPTNGIIEYYILNRIYRIPIIIYDKYNTIIYIIDNGIKYDYISMTNINNAISTSELKEKQSLVNIRFSDINADNIPTMVESLYYK